MTTTYKTSRGSKIEVNGCYWSANGNVVATTSGQKDIKIIDGYMVSGPVKIEVPAEMMEAVEAEHAAGVAAAEAAALEYHNSFDNQFDRLMAGKSNRLGVAH